MKVVMITRHKDAYNGNIFSMVHIMDHVKENTDFRVAGTDRGNNGLTTGDLQNIAKKLDELGNVHSVQIELCH